MTIFDLDGTLIDSNGIWLQIDLDFLEQRGLPHSREYSDYVAHTTYRDAAAYTREMFHLPESAEEILKIWSDMAHTAYAETIRLKPGVWEYLSLLAARGEKMALATSCMDHLCANVLDQTGIRPFFSSITTARETNRDKTFPDIFLLAAQKEGVSPSACTVFEDSPFACRGAKAAGMTVIGVYDEFFASYEEEMREICHRYIRSFEELVEEERNLQK